MKINNRQIIEKILAPFGYKLIKINPQISDLSDTDIDQIPLKLQGVIQELSFLYSKYVFKNGKKIDENESILLSKLIGTSTGEALFIIHCIQNCIGLEGDICEFGVAQGATSTLMAYEIHNTKKNIWLFDSFKGLPSPSKQDTLKDDIFGLKTIEAYKGMMSCNENLVVKKLLELSFPPERTRIIKGFIEETISQMNNYPQKICFAYVDFDFYDPIRVALTFLDQHLSIGGYIIVDDYDFFSTGAKTAVDEFFSSHSTHYSLEILTDTTAKYCILKKICE